MLAFCISVYIFKETGVILVKIKNNNPPEKIVILGGEVCGE
jgi:hypothetical protein